jgi:hypothetical protein
MWPTRQRQLKAAVKASLLRRSSARSENEVPAEVLAGAGAETATEEAAGETAVEGLVLGRLLLPIPRTHLVPPLPLPRALDPMSARRGRGEPSTRTMKTAKEKRPRPRLLLLPPLHQRRRPLKSDGEAKRQQQRAAAAAGMKVVTKNELLPHKATAERNAAVLVGAAAGDAMAKEEEEDEEAAGRALLRGLLTLLALVPVRHPLIPAPHALLLAPGRGPGQDPQQPRIQGGQQQSDPATTTMMNVATTGGTEGKTEEGAQALPGDEAATTSAATGTMTEAVVQVETEGGNNRMIDI